MTCRNAIQHNTEPEMTSKRRVGTALLIIDVQYDFLPGGALAVEDSDSILPNILPLISAASSTSTYEDNTFDALIATQDYHPQDHVSFASNHEGAQVFTEKELSHPVTPGESIRQMMWPDHCIQGTRGAELEESIKRELKSHRDKGDVDVLLIRKGTDANIDAYSAVADNSYTRFTPLIRYLSSNQRLKQDDSSATGTAEVQRWRPPIEVVIVVGLALDYCLFSSAMDLLKFGLKVIVPLDCSRGVTKDGCKDALGKLRAAGAVVVDTHQDALKYVEVVRRGSDDETSKVMPFMQALRDSQRDVWS